MKRPILMKGERLIDVVTKRVSGGEKSLPKTYNEAKNILCASLKTIEREVYENRENFLKNEVIVSVKMEEGFLAKSYRPDFLTNGDNMTLVGARKSYPTTDESVVGYSENKIYFYRTSLKGVEELRLILENDSLSETNKKAVCRIKDMEFLKQEEKICGFLETDTTLDVEIVLHPLMIDYNEALEKIQEVVGCESEVRSYENGPTFILVNMPVEKLNKLSSFNFLRTVHPLREIELQQDLRQTVQNGPTRVLEEGREPQIIVGVFDGGISSNNTILNKYVKSHDLSSLPAECAGIKHGTNV